MDTANSPGQLHAGKSDGRLNHLSSRLVHTFMEQPGRFLIGILVIQVVLWTVVPWLTYRGAPIDVMENIGWGRAWQLGYHAHPPLQAWLTEIAVTLGGGAIWPAYLLSQIAIVLTYLPIYLLGRDLAGPRGGLLAVIAFSLVYYANWPTPEFNANVVQMPIWALAGWAFWRATATGRMTWWVGLGVLCALAVYAKYSAVILVGALVLTSILVPPLRLVWKTGGPYAAAGVALVLVAPHVTWLVASDFLPVRFAEARAGNIAGFDRLLVPARFMGAQALDHLAAALVLLIGGASMNRVRPGDAVSFDATTTARQFALCLAAVPYGLAVLFALVTGYGLRDMWGAPMAVWVTLAAILLLPTSYRLSRLPALLGSWLVLFIGTPLVQAAFMAFVAPGMTSPPFPAWPTPVVSQALTDAWKAHTDGAPLRIVAGDKWAAGIPVTYSPDRPSIFTDASYDRSPWIDNTDIQSSGVLFVWRRPADGMPERYAEFGPMSATGTVSIPFRTGAEASVEIGWAVRPPGQ